MTSEHVALDRALFVMPEEILTSFGMSRRNLSYAAFMLKLNEEHEREIAPSAGSQSHPSPDQLERFMTNRLSASETSWVIRHLLKGCPVCSQVTGQLWRLGSKTPLSPEGQT